MPRQPYLQLVGRKKGAEINFQVAILGNRPELESIIARCVMAWPTVEIEMAMILGHLIGAKDAATLAVFQHLRRSSAQREAIMEAANVVLNDIDKELISASLNAHKAIESERNSLCHGHFGISSLVEDGLLWMSTADYVPTKSHLTLNRRDENPPLEEFLRKIWVYRAADLWAIFKDIEWLGTYWYDFLKYLRVSVRQHEARDQRYRQLCGQPHIARELETLRRKNSPLGQPPPTAPK